MLKDLSYDQIQAAAEEIARSYRQLNEVPKLPNEKTLSKYKEILNNKYLKLANKVKEHISHNEPEGGHGFEHLEYVATMAGYFAETEGADNEVIEMAILAGLFHDSERHLGFGEDHMIAGGKTTRLILRESGIKDGWINIIALVVRNHDLIEFNPGDETTRIVFESIFDPDHFRYGFEREDTFWRMKEKRGVPPEKVIHDYQFLPPFRNAWKTKLGKEIGPKIIDFGMAIAREIERRFSVVNYE